MMKALPEGTPDAAEQLLSSAAAQCRNKRTCWLRMCANAPKTVARAAAAIPGNRMAARFSPPSRK